MADESVSVTVSLGASGAYPPVEFEKKTYRLGHPTQIVKAEYEVGIVEAEKRAIAAGVRNGLFTPTEAAAEKMKLSAALDRGDHRTGKPLWLAYAFQHPETGDTSRVMTGLLIFVHCLFRQNHPAMTFAEAQAIWDGSGEDLRLALKQVVPDFFGWAGGAMGLPPDALKQLTELAATQVGKVFPAPPTPTTTTPPSTSSS